MTTTVNDISNYVVAYPETEDKCNGACMKATRHDIAAFHNPAPMQA